MTAALPHFKLVVTDAEGQEHFFGKMARSGRRKNAVAFRTTFDYGGLLVTVLETGDSVIAVFHNPIRAELVD